MTGLIEFSRDMSCWTWLCTWGCFGWDCESEAEAVTKLHEHDCDRGA